MPFVDGLSGLVLLLEIFAFIAGLVILGIVYVILTKIGDRIVRLGVLLFAMVIGFSQLMNVDDGAMLLMGMILYGVPLAVLIPPFVTGTLPKELVSFNRIIICDIIVSSVGILLPHLLVSSGLTNVPSVSWHSPFANGLIYFGVMVLFIGIAMAVYLIMRDSNAAMKEK